MTMLEWVSKAIHRTYNSKSLQGPEFTMCVMLEFMKWFTVEATRGEEV